MESVVIESIEHMEENDCFLVVDRHIFLNIKG